MAKKGSEHVTTLKTKGVNRVKRDLAAVAAGEKKIGVATQGAATAMKSQKVATDAAAASAGRAKRVFGGMFGGFLVGSAAALLSLHGLRRALQALKEGTQDLDIERAFFNKFKRGNKLLKDARTELKGAVEDTDIQKLFIVGTNLGMTAENLLAISRAAANLAGQTGEDTKQLFEEMVRSLASGRTQTIKARGVQIDMNQAVREYAALIGKIPSQLSDMEKGQAALRGLMAQNTKLFKKGAKTTSDSYKSASATVGNFFSTLKQNSVIITAGLINDWKSTSKELDRMGVRMRNAANWTRQYNEAMLKIANRGNTAAVVLAKLPPVISEATVKMKLQELQGTQNTAVNDRLQTQLRGHAKGTDAYSNKIVTLLIQAGKMQAKSRARVTQLQKHGKFVRSVAGEYVFWSKTVKSLTKLLDLNTKAQVKLQKAVKPKGKPRRGGGRRFEGTKGAELKQQGPVRQGEIPGRTGLFGGLLDVVFPERGGTPFKREGPLASAGAVGDQVTEAGPGGFLEKSIEMSDGLRKIGESSLVAKDGLFGVALAFGEVFTAMQQGTGPALAATGKFLKGVVKQRSAYAAWEAGMQYYLGFSTMFTNPPQSIAHFIAAAGLTAQAVRPLFGGGGGARGGVGGGPQAPQDRSLIPRADRSRRQGGTTIIQFNDIVTDPVEVARRVTDVVNNGVALDASIGFSQGAVREGLVGGI